MRYTDNHEWVLLQENIATIGITNRAQNELGEVVYVELPKINRQVRVGEEIAVLESTKAAVDIYTPLSGEIVEVNDALKASPELINQSSEKEGWLVKIQVEDTSSYEKLLSAEEYEDLQE